MSNVTVEQLEVSDPGWSFTMNSYIVRDTATGAAAIVDPGAEADRLLKAAGPNVVAIWITHSHWDHVQALEAVRQATGAPVIGHALDEERVPGGLDQRVDQGDTLTLGKAPVKVVFIPGHAPGHIAFIVPGHVLGGDILFPGGPGHTRTPEAFQTLFNGIKTHLLSLDDAVVVHPGHGEPGTIGQARCDIAAFETRGIPDGLFGDVTWV